MSHSYFVPPDPPEPSREPLGLLPTERLRGALLAVNCALTDLVKMGLLLDPGFSSHVIGTTPVTEEVERLGKSWPGTLSNIQRLAVVALLVAFTRKSFRDYLREHDLAHLMEGLDVEGDDEEE